jgi:hypothetical protein
MPDQPPALRPAAAVVGRAARGCLVIVLVGIVLAPFLVYWFFRSMFPPPPDVAATARSSAVVAADRAATRTLDERLRAAVAAMTPDREQALSIDDGCAATARASVGSRSWVECDRIGTAYLGVDGDLAPFLDTADRALRQAGWQSLHQPDPVHGQTTVLYYDQSPVTVRLGWGQRPSAPATAGAGRPLGDWVYRERRPADMAPLISRYRYLVTVAVDVVYFPVPDPAPS